VLNFENEATITFNGGYVSIYGIDKTSWTLLGATASAGADSVSLLNAVPNWQVGDSIAVATTSTDPDETESAVIKSIDGSSTGLTLEDDLVFKHLGEEFTITAGQDVSIRAEVVLLSRNIKFNRVSSL